jgi:hypothetical protein
MKAAVERRFDSMQASMAKQEQQIVDRGLALERVLQREADERAQGDAMIRSELEAALLAMKQSLQKEETGRNLLHKDLRQQIQVTSRLTWFMPLFF